MSPSRTGKGRNSSGMAARTRCGKQMMGGRNIAGSIRRNRHQRRRRGRPLSRSGMAKWRRVGRSGGSLWKIQ